MLGGLDMSIKESFKWNRIDFLKATIGVFLFALALNFIFFR